MYKYRARRVGGPLHCDSHVGTLQCRRIVDTVARHT